MPNPSIWGPLLGLVLVYSIVGPAFAGLTLVVTKHPRTRYFWIFSVLFAVWAAWWLAGLVRPARVFEELFHRPPTEDVQDLDYEIDRRSDHGVLLLSFRASSETLRRVVQVRMLKPAPLPSLADLVPRDLDTARWWPPPWAEGAAGWHVLGASMDYRVIEEWLFYDASSGEIRYVMLGRPE